MGLILDAKGSTEIFWACRVGLLCKARAYAVSKQSGSILFCHEQGVQVMNKSRVKH